MALPMESTISIFNVAPAVIVGVVTVLLVLVALTAYVLHASRSGRD